MSASEPDGAAPEPRLEDRPLGEFLHHQQAAALSKHLGLETVGDLLDWFPRRYLPRGELTDFTQLQLGQEVSIVSRVLQVSTRQMHTRRGSIAEVLVTDQLEQAPEAMGYEQVAPGRLEALAGAGPEDSQAAPKSIPPGNTMTLSFFNAWTAAKDLAPGSHVMFSGKVGEFRGQLTLTNPHYAVLTDLSVAQDPEGLQAPIPVYPATAHYTTDRIAAAVEKLMAAVDLTACEEPVTREMARENKLPPVATAYRMIHRPRDEEEPHRAVRYFRYREALVLQAVLAQRAARADLLRTEAFAPSGPGSFRDRFDSSLPFSLTAGQQRVGTEIAEDLARTRPMNRLLQGDVGSGKTLVALRAMLQVADGGGQSAMLAPTEVLATQHYRSVVAALGGLALAAPEAPVEQALLTPEPTGVGVALLTASMSAAQRRRALLAIATGTAQIVIGTHALLSDQVQFQRLGLAVVDEQHRFGVHQRSALAQPGGDPVHRLVMTATPIPRSVAMTVFGDLSVSVLDELPAGRQQVTTHVVSLDAHPGWEQRLWQRSREEIEAGHQVFVVVPTIGEESASGPARSAEKSLQSVEALSARLRQEPALAGARIESLHGRMSAEQKAATMDRMSRGEVDLLVATTVIEVGVDVPNATLMVIMDADRLGISTLHQLRGRIGRGSLTGTCLLVTEQEAEGPSMPRLQAVASTTDGFELSTLDLEQRREGDILGSSQSGTKSTLKTLSVVHHGKIIEAARRDAFALVAEDPQLRTAPGLAAAMRRTGAAETTEYLYQS